MSGTSLFNVRMDDDLLETIEARAEQEGIRKSVWAREVLGAVAYSGLTMEDLAEIVKQRSAGGRSPHPARYLPVQLPQAGRTEHLVRGCLHPETARKRLAFSVVCGLCGATVRRT